MRNYNAVIYNIDGIAWFEFSAQWHICLTHFMNNPSEPCLGDYETAIWLLSAIMLPSKLSHASSNRSKTCNTRPQQLQQWHNSNFKVQRINNGQLTLHKWCHFFLEQKNKEAIWKDGSFGCSCFNVLLIGVLISECYGRYSHFNE